MDCIDNYMGYWNDRCIWWRFSMTTLPFNPSFKVSKHKVYSVIDLDGDEHRVEVDWDKEILSEDESYASINLMWSLDEDRELFEGEIAHESFAKLQTKLDDLAMSTAHEDYYERAASRAFDRAKDWNKYGE